MWIRRAFFGWLIPAAFVLPLWLFVSWGLFSAGGWAFVWVLFLAIPSVLVGQLVLSLLVRIRPSVRAERAVSWWDVAGFGLWHLLTLALGFYGQTWWPAVFVLAVLAGIGLSWLVGWQLWRQTGARAVIMRAGDGTAYIPPPQPRAQQPDHPDHPVIVVEENR